MAAAALKIQPNSQVRLGEEVVDLGPEGDGSVMRTTVAGEARTYAADKVVVCAGLQADRLARKDGVKLKERVVGFRGDYYELEDHAKHKVKNLIYPVPNPDFPFLGVHFTRMTNGEIECGPNAVFTFKREGYGKTDFDFEGHHGSPGVRRHVEAVLQQHGLRHQRVPTRLLQAVVLEDPSAVGAVLDHGRHPARARRRAGAVAEPRRRHPRRFPHRNHRPFHPRPQRPVASATASLAIGDYVADRFQEQFS